VVFNNIWHPDDSLGLGVAHARNGKAYLLENPGLLSAETSWELSYFTPIVDYLSWQVSAYYIAQPAMVPTGEDALAIGTRAYIEF